MPSKLTLLGLTAILSLAQAAEEYPALPTWKCTTAAGCVQQNTSVVLDQTSGQATNNPGSRTTADYTAMGVSTAGNAVTMYHYVEKNGAYVAASPRIYLLDSTGEYVMMDLLNAELSVDVDLSALPCGENGAFYLSQMKADGSGGSGSYGAAGGSGYCDAQCPSSYCCSEMDILEANSEATAMTPHPCLNNACDSAGCGYNPYGSGLKSFWGKGYTVDTSQVFTVITQFAETNGVLSSVTRKYIQNGQTIASGVISSCDSSAGSYGGLTGMGQSLGAGMVLVMSIWNDATGEMSWLDSGNAGPCATGTGYPSVILANEPTTHVIFSNIRWGEIGSTTTA